MSAKFNGMKRAGDWVGKRVVLTRDVGNGYCVTPAGYAGRITHQYPGGLEFEGDKCECCGVQPRIRLTGYHKVRVVDAAEVAA